MTDGAPRPGHSTRPADTAGQSAIRDLRKQLAQGEEKTPELRYELLAMFVRNELAAQWTILILALIFALASMFWAPQQQAITWLVIVVAAKAVLLEVCRQFRDLPQSEVNVDFWSRRLITVEAIGGVAWACFALIDVNTVSSANQAEIFTSHVFLFASLIVVLAIRMTFASTVLPILYVGTIPMTLAVVTRLLLQQDPFYIALASLAVGVHIYFIFLAKGLQTTAISMLEYRLQKDLLIAELAEAKSISDAARRRAEDANLAKSRFLATMSHELRTPLNAVLGFSEVMKSELLGPIENPTYREYADNIHSSGSHLLHLINEILDLSRIEAGKYDLNEKPIRLCDILDDSRSLLKLKAETKGVQIIEDYDLSMPQLWADERAVRQICLNLLSNAVKFTPRGGEIRLIAAMTGDGEQMISFCDTGPGIPEDEIPKVLEAFGQGSLAHETAEGGTGLGLPIVCNLLELHGGRLDIQSELRKGTIATAYFPRSRVLQNMAPVQPTESARQNSRATVTGPPTLAGAAPPPATTRLPRAPRLVRSRKGREQQVAAAG